MVRRISCEPYTDRLAFFSVSYKINKLYQYLTNLYRPFCTVPLENVIMFRRLRRNLELQASSPSDGPRAV